MGISQAEYDILVGNVTVSSRKAVYQHRRGEMTGTELRYEETYLQPALQAGLIANYAYEGEVIKLGHNAKYTPDFVSIDADGVKTFHECKGSGPVREASAVRFKWAVTLNPDCRFIWARERKKKDGGGFVVKEFSREQGE